MVRMGQFAAPPSVLHITWCTSVPGFFLYILQQYHIPRGRNKKKQCYLTFLSYHKQFSFKYLFAHVKGANSNFAFAVRLFASSSDDELNPRDYSQEVVDAEPF